MRPRKEHLLDELETFVHGRLTLIMLPVCTRLRDEERVELADAMAVALRDIRVNIENILGSYGDDL